MAESKYGKYICTELEQVVVMPGYKGPQTIGQGHVDGYRWNTACSPGYQKRGQTDFSFQVRTL